MSEETKLDVTLQVLDEDDTLIGEQTLTVDTSVLPPNPELKFTLQESDSPDGPWTDIPETDFTIRPLGELLKLCRNAADAGDPQAVSALEALEKSNKEWLRLESEGSQLFKPVPDGEMPIVEASPEFTKLFQAAQEQTYQGTASILLWWSSQQAQSGAALPGTALPPPLRAQDFPLYTAQEADAMLRAVSDGRTGHNWKSDPQAATRSHNISGLTHSIRLALTDQEREDGLVVNTLERITERLDADDCFAMMYVSRLLAPPAPLPPNALAAGWIDLDDVAAKIWPPPRSTKEREERRLAVYQFLLFGERAEIIGKRTGTYRDPNTGEEIPTRIDGPIWRFMDKERAKDATLSLFPSAEVPLRVELAVSRDWTRLTQNPKLAQYLPMGELLGAIPGNKPSGAWARVIGLALANTWRREPQMTLAGTLKITHRELLTRYPPKTATPQEVLNGPQPGRAITYWREALAILASNGFLAKEGEAALTEAQMKAALPRYEWQDTWLNGIADLHPGPTMRPAVEASAASLPAYKPRQLTAPKRRGRPRKKPQEA